jgi:hypothetical protein
MPHGAEENAMTDDQFRDAFNRVERHIEQRYGLPVVITDVPDPFTGDLDGATILVDYDLSAEDALFILVHLFGHTVQWNVSPADRALGLLDVHDPSDELLASLARYEQDAARYSLQLFHEAGCARSRSVAFELRRLRHRVPDALLSDGREASVPELLG